MSPTSPDEVQHAAGEPCPVLALAGGVGSLAVCSLCWHGWWLTGHRLDVVPCLITALVTAFLVEAGGRLQVRTSSLLSAAIALVTIILGKILAWDLLGLVAQYSTAAAAVTPSWHERLAAAWREVPENLWWLNAASYLATPFLAAFVIPAVRWLDRHAAGVRAQPQAEPPGPTLAGKKTWPWKAAAALWAVATLAIFCLVRHPERTGFLVLSMPCVREQFADSLLGFACLVDGRPVNAETIPAQEHVTWFSGAVRSDNNFRFMRAGHAFLAVHLSPLFGIERALLAVNLLAWWGSLVMVWRVASRWFEDPLSSWLATSLAAAGCGFLFHLDATTPHLLSFALYYGSLLILIESGIMDGERLWRTHALIGLAIGLFSITYNVGVMALAVYAIVGLRRQRWIHLVGAGLLAITVRGMWRIVLPALGINILDVEGERLGEALQMWRAGWDSGVLAFLRMVIGYLVEAATACESPLVMVLGAAGCAVVLRPRQRWFACVAVSMPILACTLFAPRATARGYIVYGFSLILFVAAGRLLALGLRRHGWVRTVATAGIVVCLASQFVWGTAHFRGWLGPITTYFLGWDDGFPVLRQVPTEVVSLTGAEPVPAAFGRAASLTDAGAVMIPAAHTLERRSRLLALLTRAHFVTAIAALLCVGINGRNARRFAVGTVLLASIVAAEWAYRTTTEGPNPFYVGAGLQIEPGGVAEIRIRIAEESRQRILAYLQSDKLRCGLYFAATGDLDMQFQMGEQAIPLQSAGVHMYELPAETLRNALHPESWLSLALANPGTQPVMIAGWQQRGIAERQVTGAISGQALPAIELRCWNPQDGFLQFAAF